MPGRRVLATYCAVAGAHSLATSLVWSINTLFLLAAGLDLAEVFLVHATTTAVIALCEIPTGVVADARGRRTSVVLSTLWLAAGTLTWVVAEARGSGPGVFALGAAALGLGTTFYSGAAEAWLVDALERAGGEVTLETALARGQLVTGAAAVAGTAAGGWIAVFDLAWPYVARLSLLGVVLALAWRGMEEPGFVPRPLRVSDLAHLARTSLVLGARRPGLKVLLAVSFLQYGMLTWAFHAWQPYLLDLLGRDAPWVVGVVGALVTLATLAGNVLVERLARRGFGESRTALVIAAAVLALATAGLGLARSFGAALFLLLLLSAASGVTGPLKQAALHRRIPAPRRAALLSVDSLVSNAGGVVGQSSLGAVARAGGLGTGYVTAGLAAALALPLLARLGRTREDGP